MPLPNLGPNFDLARRLADLERRVQTLAGNQLAQAFSATQSDGSVGLSIRQRKDAAGATAFTVYQGPNTPRDSQTGLHQALLYIGQLFVNGQPSTSGLILSRPNGKQIMTAGAGGFSLNDAAGTQIFGPDETSGQGIGRPYIPLPTPAPLSTGTWPSTSATTWTSISQANVYLQQPKIRWQATAYCPAGVTGQVQLMLPGGTALGQVWPVAAGGFTNIDETVTVPASLGFLTATAVIVNAQVTGGTGSIACQVFGLYGRQS